MWFNRFQSFKDKGARASETLIQWSDSPVQPGGDARLSISDPETFKP